MKLGPSPPTSTSRPPDIIHVIGVSRPSPFMFCHSSTSMCYTEHKAKNKNGEGLGKEATFILCTQKLKGAEKPGGSGVHEQ